MQSGIYPSFPNLAVYCRITSDTLPGDSAARNEPRTPSSCCSNTFTSPLQGGAYARGLRLGALTWHFYPILTLLLCLLTPFLQRASRAHSFPFKQQIEVCLKQTSKCQPSLFAEDALCLPRLVPVPSSWHLTLSLLTNGADHLHSKEEAPMTSPRESKSKSG